MSGDCGLRACLESFKMHEKAGISEWRLQFGEIANVCLIGENLGFSETCDTLPVSGPKANSTHHYILWSGVISDRW